MRNASAPGTSVISRLNGWPVRSPADASPTASRRPAHGSGPMWIATPSSQWTCTTYSLPVSRRTLIILRRTELDRIDEDARQDDVVGGPRRSRKRQMPLVKIAHRRDETDAPPLPPDRCEFRPKLTDR